MASNDSGEKEKEHWMNSKWRPMMGWMYMLVCLMDFVGFPVLWSLLQAMNHGNVTSQWQPLTLQGAGLFHLAMGAVIGISAYGRTQEKLNGAETGGLGSFGPGVGTTYIPPTANTSANINVGNQSPAGNNFGNTTNNFGGATSGFNTSSSGGSAFGSSSAGGFGSTNSSFGATATPPAGSFGSSTSSGAGAFGTSVGTPATPTKPIGPPPPTFPSI